MSHLNVLWNFLGHYKYPIVIILGMLFVGVLDENSVVNRVRMELRISDLKAEIQQYKMRDENDKKKIRELRHTPGAFEKIARERYFMKADDEDVFVLSDDNVAEDTETEVNKDETIK